MSETNKVIKYIDEHGKGLADWDIKFISDLIDNPQEFYSDNQITQIYRIYEEKCK